MYKKGHVVYVCTIYNVFYLRFFKDVVLTIDGKWLVHQITLCQLINFYQQITLLALKGSISTTRILNLYHKKCILSHLLLINEFHNLYIQYTFMYKKGRVVYVCTIYNVTELRFFKDVVFTIDGKWLMHASNNLVSINQQLLC